jgi:DNA polymerase-3 subunit alpha
MKNQVAKLKPADYVHLHNHTQHSLLDGLTKIPDLIKRVEKLGMKSVAITDHGTMSGVIEFYKASNEAGIKPVIGMEAYVALRLHTDKDPAKDRQYYHLTMLAMNLTGYQNLMRLSSIANLDGFYYRPRIDRELLERYSEGIIVLSGCIGGEVSDALRQGQYQQAKKSAEWYKATFKDRYFIEVMDHGHPDHPTAWDEQDKVNQQLLKLAGELDLPAVVTCDAHYLMHEDQEAHEILLCVQTGAFLSDEQRFSLKEFELHVADPKDVIGRWGQTHPELITNTAKIASMCDFEIQLGNILIPKFPTPKNQDEGKYLELLVWQGLTWRYAGVARQDLGSITINKAQSMLSQEIIDRT